MAKRGRPKGSTTKKKMLTPKQERLQLQAANKKTSQEMTAAESRAEVRRLRSIIQDLKDGEYHQCRMCGEYLRNDKFYLSTEEGIITHVTPICKECALDVAMRKDLNGERHEPTKESLIEALQYLNKPFINVIYNAALQQANNYNATQRQTNFAKCYFRIMQMQQYAGLQFADSDFFKDGHGISMKEDETTGKTLEASTRQQFLQDKEDIIRLLHYDPFCNEALEDQPFLYSQLVGLLDSSEDANEDMMRNASCISIVRGFLQVSKLDDAIADAMANKTTVSQSAPTIKNLQDSKQKLLTGITKLAEENCISLAHSRNSGKGENTWTGKLKKIKDLNLREAEVNGFDMETCRGMRQVMDMSNQSIMQALRLDESEYSDMIADQRQMITDLERKKEDFKELSRILLRENLDLKDTMEEHNLLQGKNLIDLNELYSRYANNNHAGEEVLEDVIEDEEDNNEDTESENKIEFSEKSTETGNNSNAEFTEDSVESDGDTNG